MSLDIRLRMASTLRYPQHLTPAGDLIFFGGVGDASSSLHAACYKRKRYLCRFSQDWRDRADVERRRSQTTRPRHNKIETQVTSKVLKKKRRAFARRFVSMDARVKP